jgi:hypothetical protein
LRLTAINRSEQERFLIMSWERPIALASERLFHQLGVIIFKLRNPESEIGQAPSDLAVALISREPLNYLKFFARRRLRSLRSNWE